MITKTRCLKELVVLLQSHVILQWWRHHYLSLAVWLNTCLWFFLLSKSVDQFCWKGVALFHQKSRDLYVMVLSVSFTIMWVQLVFLTNPSFQVWWWQALLESYLPRLLKSRNLTLMTSLISLQINLKLINFFTNPTV